MRLLIGAIATCASFAAFFACASFDDADPTSTSDASSSPDGVASGDSAVDAASPTCVPDPNEPFDAGPENDKCGPNGEQIDLASSQDHCGFCGNRCATKCENGTCTAEDVTSADTVVTVSSGASTSVHLLYGSAQGACASARVFEYPLAGGQPTQLFTLDAGCVEQLGVVNDDLYYVHSGVGVQRTPLMTPQDDQPPIIASTSVSNFHLTEAAIFVRFNDGAISRTNLDGSNPTVMHDDKALMFHLLSGDTTSGWWLTGPRDGSGGVVDQGLWTRTVTGGSTTKRIGGLAGVKVMVLDDAYVYLVTQAGAVLRVAKEGPNPVAETISKLDLPTQAPRAIAIAGDYLYIGMSQLDSLLNGPFDLYRVKKCGGRARRIGASYMFGTGMAVAGGHLYFSNVSTLSRFALPQ